MTEQLPPAISIKLKGQYLIEASAGTGKTWTLTGIVLRLIVEQHVACQQIIATTFTRAAAAEMRARILARLQDFKYVLSLGKNQLDILFEQQPHLISVNNSDSVAANHIAAQQLVASIHDNLTGRAAELWADPINYYLTTAVVASALSPPQTVSDNSQTDNNSDVNRYNDTDNTPYLDLNNSIQRVNLAILTFDQLFVGTVDSLCQRLLTEFSVETGYDADVSMVEDEQSHMAEIIHDNLREYYVRLQASQLDIFILLHKQGKIKDVNDLLPACKKAMQFFHIPIQPVDIPEFNIEPLTIQINYLLELDDAAFRDFFTAKDNGIRKNSKLLTRYHDFWQEIKQALLEDKHLVTLSKGAMEFIQALIDAPKSFTKNTQSKQQDLLSLSYAQQLLEVAHGLQSRNAYTQALESHLVRLMCYQVRKKLPLILERRRLTTYTLQLDKLNSALNNPRTGQNLARMIRHNYPIALIDESQDLNQEQAHLVESIYLKNNPTKDSQFLLLVGDPKQAIYRFRGGDVFNYLHLKQYFDAQHIHTLDTNRRSSSTLITGLNTLYENNAEKGMANPAYLGSDISYQTIKSVKPKSKLRKSGQQPLSHDIQLVVIEKALSFKAHHAIAMQIAQLLDAKAPWQWQHDSETTPVTVDDICVLSKNKADLNQVQSALQNLDIPVLRINSQSVFSEQMAQDMAAIMYAMLHSFQLAAINRVLLSQVFGLDKHQLDCLQQEESRVNESGITFSDFQQLLTTCGEQWRQYGFMSAWQTLMQYQWQWDSDSERMNGWQRLANVTNSERLLIDARHLLEIIQTKTTQMSEFQLLDWFYIQLSQQSDADWAIQRSLASDSGVKLMTIHKSKGLEFPIVFAIGVEKGTSNTFTQPYLYTVNKDTQKRAANQPNKNPAIQRQMAVVGNDEKELEKKEAAEELRRLAYVAYTRASDFLCIITNELGKKSPTSALQSTLNTDNQFELPERLTGAIDRRYVTADEFKVFNPKEFKLIKTEKPATEVIDYADLTKNYRFYFQGWGKTSFTALARDLRKENADTAVDSPDHDQFESNTDRTATPVNLYNSPDSITPLIEPIQQQRHRIRFDFVKGANAGTFLHYVLEQLDFQSDDALKDWALPINNGIRDYHLPLIYASPSYQRYQLLSQMLPDSSPQALRTLSLRSETEFIEQLTQTLSTTQLDRITQTLASNQYHEVIAWLDDVVHTPLLASGVNLKNVPTNQRIAEMGFSLGLNQTFKVAALNDIFRAFNKPLQLDPQQQPYVLRYLKGEIDLVYQHDDRYYVVDYKSNYLGDTFSDYRQEAINTTMTQSGYWLQAAIYQVALHRFLTVRLPDYHPEQHLGSVEYAFIRGMHPDANTGRIAWDMPVDMLYQLDNLLGYTQPYDAMEME